MATQTPAPVDTSGSVPMASRWEARATRRAKRRAMRGRSYSSGGVGLVVIGILLLLQNGGYLTPGQQIWGVAAYLLAGGAAIAALARYRVAGSRFTHVVASAIGAALLLAFVGTMLTFDLSWGVLWPMLLIIPGVMAIVGSAARADSDL